MRSLPAACTFQHLFSRAKKCITHKLTVLVSMNAASGLRDWADSDVRDDQKLLNANTMGISCPHHRPVIGQYLTFQELQQV